MSFSFGTPSSAPATGGLSSGFSFGANKPATPGFGLATSQPSTGIGFGTPATSAPAFGTTTPAFGATSGFGNTSAFGASSTGAFGQTSTAPTFGTAGTTPAFGATSTAPAFGANTTPAFGSTLGFGGTSTAPAFGTATPSFGTSSAAPAFGSTPAFGQTSSTGFGAGLGTGGLNFGAGSTSTASTGLTLGGTTTTSSGLGGLGGFGFGNTSTQSTGFGGGLFGANTTSTGLFAMYLPSPPGSPHIPITQTFQMLPQSNVLASPISDGSATPTYHIKTPTRDTYNTILPSYGAKLGTTTTSGLQPSASGAPSLGLGGIAPAGTATTASGDGKTEPPKQMKLPNEIASTVDTFKEFVKKQKSLSSEIMRVSIKPLHKVSRTAETTLRAALGATGAARAARAHSKRLRAQAAAALAAAETTNATGGCLEGAAPPAYVNALISELEQQLLAFRRQMDAADRQMHQEPKLLTEQELTLGIRRMHSSLVALAGRLQAVHARVEREKEQYRNLRKYVLKDPADAFNTTPASSSLDQMLWESEGSRKKQKPNRAGAAPGSAVLADPRAVLGNMQQLAGPTPFTYIGSTMSPFPSADTSTAAAGPAPGSSVSAPTPAPASDSFQLQKPPGKRGKQ